MKFIRGSIFLILISFGCSRGYAADCHVDHYNFVFGSDAQTIMTVKTGKVCTSGFTFRGGGLQSMQVQQAAQNGVAAVSVQRLAYKPNPGFVGHDSFVIKVTGETMGRIVHRGETNIMFNVSVVP